VISWPDRNQPGLPIEPWRCQTMTQSYKRHGSITLLPRAACSTAGDRPADYASAFLMPSNAKKLACRPQAFWHRGLKDDAWGMVHSQEFLPNYF
jgi:hypothetical protein